MLLSIEENTKPEAICRSRRCGIKTRLIQFEWWIEGTATSSLAVRFAHLRPYRPWTLPWGASCSVLDFSSIIRPARNPKVKRSSAAIMTASIVPLSRDQGILSGVTSFGCIGCPHLRSRQHRDQGPRHPAWSMSPSPFPPHTDFHRESKGWESVEARGSFRRAHIAHLDIPHQRAPEVVLLVLRCYRRHLCVRSGSCRLREWSKWIWAFWDSLLRELESC